MSLRRGLPRVVAWLATFVLLASPARAVIDPGQSAPAFTKNVLGGTPWPTATLAQFAGKVVLLHILGYD